MDFNSIFSDTMDGFRAVGASADEAYNKAIDLLLGEQPASPPPAELPPLEVPEQKLFARPEPPISLVKEESIPPAAAQFPYAPVLVEELAPLAAVPEPPKVQTSLSSESKERVPKESQNMLDSMINQIPPNIRAFAGGIFTQTMEREPSLITEKYLTPETLEFLRHAVRESNGKVLDYTLWDKLGASSVNDLMSNVTHLPSMMKTFLGEAAITTDKNGDTWINDRFNFAKNIPLRDLRKKENDISILWRVFKGGDPKTGMPGVRGPYGVLRMLASMYGPEDGKGAPIKINLGNLHDMARRY